MLEKLKEFVRLFNEDVNIQENINNKTWEGQRLLLIGNILETFASYSEIQSLVFEYQSYDLKPNNSLNISVTFYPDKSKDLKTCFFLNEHISNKFSNTKFQILNDLKKEELSKLKFLKYHYMLEDRTLNKKFYEEVFSLTENTYPLFQYFILDEKVNDKLMSNTTKKKI